MKKRRCLIIDDQLRGIQGIIENTKRIARDGSIEIDFEGLNPLNDEFYKNNPVTDEYVVDEISMSLYIEKERAKKDFDLVITDFDMAPNFTGLDFIYFYRKINQKAKFIIYSGKPEQIADNLLKEKDRKRDFIKKIDSLLKANVLRIIDKKDSLSTVMLEFIKKQPLEQIIENKLIETQPNLIFKSIYPSLSGHSVKEIANILTKDTEQAEDFKVELLDQFVDFILELNKDNEG